MKTSIVADGPFRFARTVEHQKRRRELAQAIVAKYARQLAEADFFRAIWIRHRMRQELRREWRKMAPSPHSLWFGLLSPRRTQPSPGQHAKDESKRETPAA